MTWFKIEKKEEGLCIDLQPVAIHSIVKISTSDIGCLYVIATAGVQVFTLTMLTSDFHFGFPHLVHKLWKYLVHGYSIHLSYKQVCEAAMLSLVAVFLSTMHS